MWLNNTTYLTLNPNLALTLYYLIHPPLYSKHIHIFYCCSVETSCGLSPCCCSPVILVRPILWIGFIALLSCGPDLWRMCCSFCLSPVTAMKHLLKRPCPYLLCGCLRRPRPFYYCCIAEGAAPWLLRVPHFMLAARIVCWGCYFSFAVCAASSPSQLIFVTAFVYGVLVPTVVARV